MRIRRLHNHSTGATEGINVTPLIDVVMCLIIFFLIVGKLATERGMAVRLPDAASGHEEQATEVIVVTIAKKPGATPAGQTGGPSGGPTGSPMGAQTWGDLGVVVQVDGESVSDSKSLELAMADRLSVQTSASIQIRADRDLTYGVVDPVLAALRNAGAKSVRFATERVR
jgi:biopolymer transport protein ExbD